MSDFNIVEVVSKKGGKKPRRWKKNKPISDSEFTSLISKIRNAPEPLTDEEVMRQVKDYYGIPRTPDFFSSTDFNFSKSNFVVSYLLNIVFAIIVSILFIATVSFVSGSFVSDKGNEPIFNPDTGTEVIFDSSQ